MKECFSLLFLIVCLSTNIYCQTGPCPNINHEGFKTIVQTTSTETITREYIIYVPANYNFNEPAPLVINLHGFGDCASFFAETVGARR